MTEKTVLYKSITKFAFGFLIILINISIAGFDILPDFVGYILFISAISALAGKYRKINLMKPLAVILLIWSVISIIILYVDLNEAAIIKNLIHLVIDIIQIYFNFQLLTHISEIAQEYDEETKLAKRLIKLRNVYTVLNTAVTSLANIPVLIALNGTPVVLGVVTVMAVITVIIAIIITVTLFSVRKLFRNQKNTIPEIPENPTE